MIPFDEIASRLSGIRKKRPWLADASGRSESSIRAALAPNATPSKRSELLQKVLSDAIEREEANQAGEQPEPMVMGYKNVFLDDDQLDRADRASRAINALSLTDFCRDAILFRAEEILNGRLDPLQPASSAPTNIIELPYYGRVAAGLPSGHSDTPEEFIPVPGNYDPSRHYLLRVHGESMEPEYRDGSLIVCRKLKDGEYPSKGQDVISSEASGSYFKRLEYVKDGSKGDSPRKARPHLVSLNPNYDEVIPAADCPIIAVVVAKA